MIIRFLTRGREKILNLKTSEGVTVKSVLYEEANRIAEARLKYEPLGSSYINYGLLRRVLGRKDLIFYSGVAWNMKIAERTPWPKKK